MVFSLLHKVAFKMHEFHAMCVDVHRVSGCVFPAPCVHLNRRSRACSVLLVRPFVCCPVHCVCNTYTGCLAFTLQKPEAKKAVKPAKSLPNIPGLDSSLFKQAMAEQKSHGVEMHGPKIKRCVSLLARVAAMVLANLAGLIFCSVLARLCLEWLNGDRSFTFCGL